MAYMDNEGNPVVVSGPAGTSKIIGASTTETHPAFWLLAVAWLLPGPVGITAVAAAGASLAGQKAYEVGEAAAAGAGGAVGGAVESVAQGWSEFNDNLGLLGDRAQQAAWIAAGVVVVVGGLMLADKSLTVAKKFKGLWKQ